MGARQRLTLLAAASGAVLIVLGRTAHGAAEQLVQVPPQAWGLSDLSNAVVAGTCTCGALGALWHAVSALLALMTCPGANDPGKRCRGGAYALAARALEAWGAPAVRRSAAFDSLPMSVCSPDVCDDVSDAVFPHRVLQL